MPDHLVINLLELNVSTEIAKNALLRFQYLFPAADAQISSDCVTIKAHSASENNQYKKEFSYLLYREMIEHRYAKQRKRLVQRLYGSYS